MHGAEVDLEPFSVTSRQRGDAAYLEVSGEIDMATVTVLDDRIRTAQSNGFTGVVVDLEHVTFMDASGLGALVRAAENARRSEKTFLTVNAPAMIQKLLHITGTDYLLGTDPLQVTNG